MMYYYQSEYMSSIVSVYTSEPGNEFFSVFSNYFSHTRKKEKESKNRIHSFVKLWKAYHIQTLTQVDLKLKKNICIYVNI